MLGFVGSSPTKGTSYSGLPERPIGASWKGDGCESGTRVRISHPLPILCGVSHGVSNGSHDPEENAKMIDLGLSGFESLALLQ